MRVGTMSRSRYPGAETFIVVNEWIVPGCSVLGDFGRSQQEGEGKVFEKGARAGWMDKGL